jgi:hypothetical protein
MGAASSFKAMTAKGSAIFMVKVSSAMRKLRFFED